MKKILKGIKVGLLSLVLAACTELDIVNPNQPTAETLTAESFEDLAAGALYNVINGYSSFPESGNQFNADVHLALVADHSSTTNNYRSFWSQFSIEPRVQFNNSLTFPNLEIITDPWSNWNAAVSSSNIIIRSLKNTAETEEEKGLLATAYLAKGLALGHLSGVFDQAYLISEDVEDLASVDPVESLRPFTEVVAASLAALTNAITLYGEASGYVLPSKFLNGLAYNADQLAALANSYAAHFLATSPRNSMQADTVDWNQVKSYAQNGIADNFVINADGTNILHDFQYISGLFWYIRIDHRVLRHFNPNYPKVFPSEANAVIPEVDLKGDGFNGDERLDAYFAYSNDLSFFNLARGPQLRTHYYYSRYEELFFENGVGPTVYYRAYANDLLIAEAELRLGNKGAAIAILNNPANPRKAVGGLPDIPADISEADLQELIFAERDIELPRTVFAGEFYDMRRRDALQEGSVLHLPVPADELTVIGEPVYSYGGSANADGVNTADGSNSWLQE